jgi:hypothetical protein
MNAASASIDTELTELGHALIPVQPMIVNINDGARGQGECDSPLRNP